MVYITSIPKIKPIYTLTNIQKEAYLHSPKREYKPYFKKAWQHLPAPGALGQRHGHSEGHCVASTQTSVSGDTMQSVYGVHRVYRVTGIRVIRRWVWRILESVVLVCADAAAVPAWYWGLGAPRSIMRCILGVRNLQSPFFAGKDPAIWHLS